MPHKVTMKHTHKEVNNDNKFIVPFSSTICALTQPQNHLHAMQSKVKDAIKCMSKAMLNAVPIVEASSEEEDPKQLVDGRNRRVVGTFSASDLKGCHLATLRSWLPLNALEFVEKIPRTPLYTAATSTPERELVMCQVTSTLARVIRMVITKRVHRVWVVDQNDGLQGLVSLTDIIAAVRSALLSDPELRICNSHLSVFSSINPIPQV